VTETCIHSHFLKKKKNHTCARFSYAIPGF